MSLVSVRCTKKDEAIPQTDNKTLNKLIRRAPGTIISLGNAPVDTLFAGEENRLADKSAASFSPPALLGTVVGIVKFGDSLYIADRKQYCIWVIDSGGTIVRKAGRQGKGPGEFGTLIGIIKNTDHIFTIDNTNSHLQMFNRNLKLQATFTHLIYGNGLTGDKSISATDSLLYLPTDFNQHDKLIEVRNAVAPFDSVDAFLPRLIPPRMQPGPNNDYIIDANKQGNVAVSYEDLPYIFLFDNSHTLQRVIYLKLPEDQLPDNPSTKPTKRNSREGVGVTSVISQLALMDDGTLYFFTSGTLYELGISSGSNEYQLQKARFFTYSDALKRKDNPYDIRVSNMTVANDTIYLGSIWEEYVYRFALH